MIENSKKLKKEADKLLSDWGLLNLLNKYGQSHVVGSVLLDLMVWRDIDIELISSDPIKKETALAIAANIFNNNQVRKVSVVDERVIENPNKPKGIYIGAEYIDSGNRWKIDIWYLLEEKDMAIKKTDQILGKLNEDNRKKILDIKLQVFDNPNYRKNVTSVDIYEAVLDKGINNLEEFKKYIKDTKNLLL